jgi:hypothetical protein
MTNLDFKITLPASNTRKTNRALINAGNDMRASALKNILAS